MTWFRRCGHVMIIAAMIACTPSEPAGAPVASLQFTAQPTSTIADQPLVVSVGLLDATGGRVTSANDPVTLALGFGSGTREAVTVRASHGVATFTAFAVHEAGDAQVLQATARGLSVVSLPFTVAAGPVNAERSAVAAGAQPILSNTPTTLSFTFADAFGNAISRAPVVLSSVAGAAFTPASGVTSAHGVFQSTIRALLPGTTGVTATVAGTPVTLPAALTVADACAPRPTPYPGTFSGTLAVGDGCLVGGLPIAIHQFTVPVAGGASFTITPSFTARLEVRANPATPAVWRLANGPATVEWLLPAGAYQFRVSSDTGSGGYSVRALPVAADTGQVIRMIAAPGTYTGQSLTTTDAYDGFAYSDYFLVYYTGPCTITVRSTAFDPLLLLGNATFGGLIAFDDNSGGGTDAQLVRPACAASGGPVIIGVSSLHEGAVGSYTLSLSLDGPAAARNAAPEGVPAFEVMRGLDAGMLRQLSRMVRAHGK